MRITCPSRGSTSRLTPTTGWTDEINCGLVAKSFSRVHVHLLLVHDLVLGVSADSDEKSRRLIRLLSLGYIFFSLYLFVPEGPYSVVYTVEGFDSDIVTLYIVAPDIILILLSLAIICHQKMISATFNDANHILGLQVVSILATNFPLYFNHNSSFRDTPIARVRWYSPHNT